jgi:DNA-binding HxlR family transcriptional regulator
MPTTTATQKRAQAKVEYDAFLASCPSRQLLDRISDKWVALVLAALGADGPHPGEDCVGEPRSMRYSELSRRLAGVSQKMLTQTLRSLERDGLLTRTVTPTVPVTVTYELTDLGYSLHNVMRDIKTWAEAHMDEVLANREKYDTLVAQSGEAPAATSQMSMADDRVRP